MILAFSIYLILAIFIPIVIVVRWKGRPVFAFILAALVMILGFVAPGIIQTFQAMMIYGAGDPQLMAGAISESILNGLLGLITMLPVLALVQWISRRRHKKSF